MKRKIVLSTILLLLIAGTSGTDVYFLFLDIRPTNFPIDFTISTIGDSLTQGGEWMSVVGYGVYIPDCYQYYVYQYLHVRNLETQVRNLGIGGQTVSQIFGRLNDTVPAQYIVCMAGTNDMFRANYSDPNVATVVATHVVATYNATIFNTIVYQQSLGKGTPVLILCSAPPTAQPKGGNILFYNVIHTLNTAIKQHVLGLNRTNILFCDVYAAVSNQTGWMIPGLYQDDGVHFNNAGDQVVGEAIARVICDNYYQASV